MYLPIFRRLVFRPSLVLCLRPYACVCLFARRLLVLEPHTLSNNKTMYTVKIPSGDQQDLSWLQEDTPQPGVANAYAGRLRHTPPESPAMGRTDDKPSWLYSDDTPIRTDQKNKKIGSTRKSMVPILPSAKKAIAEAEAVTSSKTEEGCCCPSDPVLYWCRILHFIAGLCALIVLIANGYLLCSQNLEWRPILLHCYAIGFTIVILGVEMNITVLVEKLLILDFWIYRGLFYTFIGILSCKNLNFILATLSLVSDTALNILTWLMINYS